MAAARVNARVDQLLERYAPDPARPRPARSLAVVVGLTAALVLALTGVGAVATAVTNSSGWVVVAVGGAIGIGGNVIADGLAKRIESRATSDLGS